MTTFAERQAERKARTKKELADYARQEMIADYFPEAIRDRIGFVHLHGRGPTVTFKAETLADALPILAALEPVKYFYLTGGTFGHVAPREWIKPRDWEGAKEETEFCAPYLEAATGKGWTDCKIHLFIHGDGFKLIKVSIEIETPGRDWLPFMRQERNAAGRVRPGFFTRDIRRLGECHSVTWSAGSPDAVRVTRHWHDAAMWSQFVEQETKAKDAA